MNNSFKIEPEEEPVLKQAEPAQPKEKEKVVLPRNFFTTLFTEGMMTKEAATEMLPFVMFIAMLGMIYIANRHSADNNIRKIDKLNKEVKELSWDFKTMKADLMFKSKLTEVAKRVDTLGIKELVEPPKKIVVAADEY